MNKTADRTVALDKGRVDVYTKNGVTLYAYQTRDLSSTTRSLCWQRKAAAS